MNKTRAAITLITVMMAAGCGAPFAAQPSLTAPPATSTSPLSPTVQANTAEPGPTVQPTLSGGQPDLTVRVWTSVAPPVCLGPHSRTGAMVTVANAGGGDAGPFMVEVNGIWQAVADGLRAGESRLLWFDGRVFDTPWARMDVLVDPAGQVIESNEDNNAFSEPVATLTAPAPCPTTPLAPALTPAS